MPNLSPRVRFALQVLVFIAISVTQGTLRLTNIIPAGWIDVATAYFGWIAVIGSAVTTGASGLGLTATNRIAAAASLTQVSQIVTTPEIAKAAGPVGDGAKVVSNGH